MVFGDGDQRPGQLGQSPRTGPNRGERAGDATPLERHTQQMTVGEMIAQSEFAQYGRTCPGGDGDSDRRIAAEHQSWFDWHMIDEEVPRSLIRSRSGFPGHERRRCQFLQTDLASS